MSYGYDAAGNRTVYISRTAPGSPIANNDSVATTSNIAVTFDPRANDASPSCYGLTITALGAPGHGTASIIQSGTGVTYTPAANYTGSDGFTYTISDGHSGTASATIAVTVSP